MKRLTPLALVAAMVTLLVACDDNNEDMTPTVLKPIAEHILGKWSQEYSYTLKDGKQEIALPEENEALFMTYRADGTAIEQLTLPPNGMTNISLQTWTVDEANNSITVGGYPMDIVSLDDRVMELKVPQYYDTDKDEMVQGEMYFRYVRMADEPTLAEWLIGGRWTYQDGYHKENGEWVKDTDPKPDELWYEYYEDGTSKKYLRLGDQETTYEYAWAVNLKSSQLALVNLESGNRTDYLLEKVDEDTYHIFSNLDTNANGDLIKGESYDVYKRQR